MGEAQEVVRFCPGCGASVAEFDAPRFCASCGQGLSRQAEQQAPETVEEVTVPPPPPPPATPADSTAAKMDADLPALRVWPGYVALLLAISWSMGQDMSIEEGQLVTATELAMADLLLLGAVIWLVWRHIKRWRFMRKWKPRS